MFDDAENSIKFFPAMFPTLTYVPPGGSRQDGGCATGSDFS